MEATKVKRKIDWNLFNQLDKKKQNKLLAKMRRETDKILGVKR